MFLYLLFWIYAILCLGLLGALVLVLISVTFARPSCRRGVSVWVWLEPVRCDGLPVAYSPPIVVEAGTKTVATASSRSARLVVIGQIAMAPLVAASWRAVS